MTEGTIALWEIATPQVEPGAALASHRKTFTSLQNRVTQNGSVWLVARNYFHDGQLVPWPLIVADHFVKGERFRLKNILLHYSVMPAVRGKKLVPAHTSILFMVKADGKYHFDKDPIREPHIFKDIEWGKRTTGTSGYHQERESPRYPPGGRDPGNIFYKTKRDDQGYILDVYDYPLPELYDKIVLISTEEGWKAITNIGDRRFGEAVLRNKRLLERLP